MPAPATTQWTFMLGSDDGSALYIDGALIIDNSGALAGSSERVADCCMSCFWLKYRPDDLVQVLVAVNNGEQHSGLEQQARSMYSVQFTAKRGENLTVYGAVTISTCSDRCPEPAFG